MRPDSLFTELRLRTISACVGLLVSLSAAAAASPSEVADSLSRAYGRTAGPATLPETPALDDYLRLAADRSPGLRAAFFAWQAALERRGHAGALPDPGVAYAYHVEPVESRIGPHEHRLALRQAFPWFGTLGAKKDQAGEAANTAWQKFESEKRTLFYRVSAAYSDYYYLGREITVTRESLELVAFWESIARAKYRVALTRHPDVIKAQVELGKLEDRLQTLESMITAASARLAALLDLPADVVLPIPDDLPVAEVSLDRESTVQRAQDRNPDLKALAHEIDGARASMRVAGARSWPDFSVGFEYILTGPALNPAMPESGRDAWNVNVGLSLPIWVGANKSRREEAEAQYHRAQNDLKRARNDVRVFVERTIFEYEDALRKMRLYRDGLLPKAQQSLSASYTAYQADETDFLNVLDAQRELLEFQLLLERSRSNLAIRRAEIEMVTAGPIAAARE